MRGSRIVLKVDEVSQTGDEITLSVGVHVSLRCTPMKAMRGVEELHDVAVLEVELAVEVHTKVSKEELITEEWMVSTATMLHKKSSLGGAAQEAVFVEVERGRLWVLLGDDVVELVVEEVLSILIVVVEIRVAALAISKLILL